MELSTTREATGCATSQEPPKKFMELEGSLPHSQELTTCPILSHTNPAYTISPRSILTLSIHLHLGLPSGLFPCGFPTNNLQAFLFIYLVLPTYSHLPSIAGDRLLFPQPEDAPCYGGKGPI
jgi:hypothetical protein